MTLVPKRSILEKLKEGIVLGAEGYIFELERRGYVKAGLYVPEVVLDFPDVVKELHRSFLHAGSEVIVALTYYAYEGKLHLIGREHDMETLNRRAVQIANEVAHEGNALVAGNICNTWSYDPGDTSRSSKIVRAIYEKQVQWAIEEGIDFVIAETNDYLGEALVALDVIKHANLPAMVTLATFHLTHTRDGYEYIEAIKRLEDHGADIVGLNCSRGPVTMIPLIKQMRQAVNCYIAVQPVPYHTDEACPVFDRLRSTDGSNAFPLALEPFLCTRDEMAKFAVEVQNLGANYIGICCGGAPYHVRAMAEALGRIVPASKYSPALNLHPKFGSGS